MQTLLALLHLLYSILFAQLYDVQSPRRFTVSRYADTRRDEGGTPACWKRMPDVEFDRMYSRRCASRTLACGTPVLLHGPAGPSLCYVLDRGPYGRHRDGRWHSQLDLSPVPADEVGIWSPTRGPGHVRVTARILRWRNTVP